MAQFQPALKYRVSETIFDAKSMLDETNFYHQRQGAPSELTRQLTYIMGDSTKNFPISLMTLGGVGFDGKSNKGAVELDDVQFTYPIMGRIDKASMCGTNQYSGSDTPGIGNSKFKLRLQDNWIKRFYVAQSSRGVQVYVHEDPQLIGTEYEYLVSLVAASPSDFCPVSELNSNNAWIGITTAVAESESRTTESTMAMPGLYKNQMNFFRHGFSWAGNAANKMMRIEAEGQNGAKTSMWMDFAMWQYEMRWLSMCEHSYWYSRYNRQANGEILLKDSLTGKVIPTGSGLLEQIQNKSSYSTLTYDYLSNQIGDALFGQSDTAGINITLHTGRGGMRAFDRAMKAAGGTFFQNFGALTDGGKFLTGTGYNLALGGYFDSFYHIDGYYIKVKHNPVFDHGKVAMAQQAGGYIHPETGWPLESYRMVFIDDNDYDGQPNIQHVAQKGNSFKHGIIAGMANMPKSLQIMNGTFNLSNEESAMLLSTDVDKSAYTRMKSAGIQILRANRCFDMQCLAGQ